MGDDAYRREDDALGDEVVRHEWKGMPAAMAVIGVVFIGIPCGLWFAAATGAMPMGEDWGIGEYLGAALFSAMPFLGAWLLLDAYRRRNDYVVVYADGVELFQRGTHKRARFRDVVALRSEIKQTVRNGVPGPVTHRHSLRCTSGDQLVFTHGFEDIDLLAATLRAKTAEHLLPRARESLREGRSVAFGPITMTRDGLAWRNTTVPWRDVGVVDVAEGWLHAKRQGLEWLSVQAAEVDNLHLLVALAMERDFRESRATVSDSANA